MDLTQEKYTLELKLRYANRVIHDRNKTISRIGFSLLEWKAKYRTGVLQTADPARAWAKMWEEFDAIIYGQGGIMAELKPCPFCGCDEMVVTTVVPMSIMDKAVTVVVLGGVQDEDAVD